MRNCNDFGQMLQTITTRAASTSTISILNYYSYLMNVICVRKQKEKHYNDNYMKKKTNKR